MVAQTPSLQSPALEHVLPGPQVGQVPPPQSTSVSTPFFTPSVQVAAWHKPPVQTPLWQSPVPLHLRPVPQGAQEPPQSRSVSAPFFTPSMQVAATHMCEAQVPVTQSLPLTQATHWPLPSQTLPPPWVQAVPAGNAGVEGTPAVQTWSVHCRLLTGRLVSSAIDFVAPAPSHTFFWQVPAVCVGVAVPSSW